MISGISGDMSLGVLCGLGLDIVETAAIISDMVKTEINAGTEDVNVAGVMCKRLKLSLPHEHAHRTMKDIRRMLEGSAFDEKVIADSIGIFEIIAQAEGAVHGKDPEKVHFHEVGALDSIFDIAGFAYGVHKLKINSITSTLPVLGTGFVECAHGIMPVPAPATVKILEGVEIRPSQEPNEMTTPTGAALLKYYVKDFGSFGGKILASACSTGNKTFETVPNMLRGVLLEQKSAKGGLVMIETGIDDCPGEMIGHLFTVLAQAAVDVTVCHAIGKKNRPVFVVNVLCHESEVKNCAEILFANSSTAGVKYYPVERIIMDREMITVNVMGEGVAVKKLTYGGTVKYSPEWDSCVAAAHRLNTAVMNVYEMAKAKTDGY
ncbi:MAG: nickel pincer cofactor biosynthesis protein LarC [Deferribacterales bacterium]